MRIFRPILTAVVYLLIGVLEVYSYYLLKCEAIGIFAFFTLGAFIVTFYSVLADE